MLLSQLIAAVERVAPRSYQESYDNSGLLIGSPNTEVRGVLLCLDTLENIVEEAVERGCNVIIAHHPIIFSGLKSLTGKNYVERVVIKALQNGVAIYVAHTNLDNMRTGVNAKICERIGLQNTRILVPKSRIIKQLVTYIPVAQADIVRSALFAAGAGNIGNYSEASFNTIGAGTYKGNDASNAFAGEKNVRHYEAETRLEVVFEQHLEGAVLAALRKTHPYEEIAYGIFTLENQHNDIGSGMIGTLAEPMTEADFLKNLKGNLATNCIRHTALRNKMIEKVAVCGGSGSFLLRNALAQSADAFVTADFKYHEFFDAEGKIVICDVGHFESEQYTIDLLHEILSPVMEHDIPLYKTEIVTNPVFYY
jgi:dinuclear metal center YbgI/SA1388 family protein